MTKHYQKDVKVDHQALKTWLDLNLFLLQADERACLDLLKTERAGRARCRFILRIHSRMNRMRAARERKELI